MLTTTTEVPLDAAGLEPFEALIGPDRQDELRTIAAHARDVMEGRTFWHLNSTAKGGGVAEMLAAHLPYARGAGIDTRWLVIDGDEDFFTVSKRIHNQLHGDEGDGQDLDAGARRTYEATLARNAADVRALFKPGDVVLFHDPQTAGLIPLANECGASTIWRCHVGVDDPNDLARAAWSFLLPYVTAADRVIFTCDKYVWDGINRDRVVIMPPSIDPFTPKNREMDPATAEEILRAAKITHPRQPVVLQVSRWDALKDPVGVLEGFAAHVAPFTDAQLVLAGPATEGVDDDPEGAETLAEVTNHWRALDAGLRERIHLVSIPMDDEDENAAIVNALQTTATIVVQKSLAEGFGLTVAEAMWKCRPVVASALGGIIEQIVDDETGVLVNDPEDLAEFGAALRELLDDPARAARLGATAHRHVCDRFLASRELAQQFELLGSLVPA